MANLGEPSDSKTKAATLKLLLLGDTKAGKTDYAMRVAEAGFNVIYLDNDVGIQTILDKSRGLSPEALSRVFYFPIHDYTDDRGNYVPFSAQFFVDFTTQKPFLWNDTKSRVFSRADYRQLFKEKVTESDDDVLCGGDEVWEIRTGMIGPDTVVILDSYTNLIHSLQQWKASDLGVDILDVEKIERDMYTGTAHKATQFLHLMRTLRSHFIAIGHPREYQKRTPPKGSKGQVPEKDMVLEWTKMVPISTSNPHALTVGKNFSDIGWIDVTGAGTRYIDFRPSDARVIGGHSQAREKVEDYPILKVIEQVGGAAPSPKCSGTPNWLTRYPDGSFVPAGSKPKPAPLAGSSDSTAKKVGGLAGLMKPKAGG